MFHIALEAGEEASPAPARRRLSGPPAGTWPLALPLPCQDGLDPYDPQVFLDASVNRVEATNSASLERAALLQGKREEGLWRHAEDYRPPKSRVMHLPARREAGRRLGEGGREECWRRIPAGHRRPSVRFDLTDVTFIDADGRAYLAAMHRQGAEFVAADCLTRAIVAQITGGPIPDPQASEARKARSQTQLSRRATPRRTKRVAPDGLRANMNES